MKTLKEIIAATDQQLDYAQNISNDISTVALPDSEVEKVNKYVLMRLGNYGIATPISGLFEVGALPPVVSLPNLPYWIKGIINLRGEILSVINLIEFLTGKKSTQTGSPRLAVLWSGKIKVGILVDSVVATVNRPDSELTTRTAETKNKTLELVLRSTLHHDAGSYDILDVASLLKLKSLRNYYEE